MEREKGLIYSFHAFISLFRILGLAVSATVLQRFKQDHNILGVSQRNHTNMWPLPRTQENCLSCFPPFFCTFCFPFLLQPYTGAVLCWSFPIIRDVLLVLSELLLQAVVTWKRDIDVELMSAFTEQF